MVEMEVIVVTKEEQTIPANWKTAKEMRETAENWTNTELKSCIDSLMGKIYSCASKGGITLTTNVGGGRPVHFYDTVKSIMEKMGYQVKMPNAPWVGNASQWTFNW
jgi:hypothetical protein